MIVLTGVNYILGHVARPFASVQNLFFPSASHIPGSAWPCFYAVAYFLVYLAYASPFIFYYFFNTQFNKLANTTLEVVFYPLIVLFRVIKPSADEIEMTTTGKNRAL
jgi:hypothetical protein